MTDPNESPDPAETAPDAPLDENFAVDLSPDEAV